jgi:hypothetical protein
VLVGVHAVVHGRVNLPPPPASEGAAVRRPSGRLVETLTSWNGTYGLQRVPDAGGVVELDFVPVGRSVEGAGLGSFAVMDLREGPGLYEVGRRLTIDGRTWSPGFTVAVERSYAADPNAEADAATCTATYEATLQTFTF